MSSDQMPAPGKIKLIKFPPPEQEKTSNARGMPGGGVVFKLRFDWYIILFSFTLAALSHIRNLQKKQLIVNLLHSASSLATRKTMIHLEKDSESWNSHSQRTPSPRANSLSLGSMNMCPLPLGTY